MNFFAWSLLSGFCLWLLTLATRNQPVEVADLNSERARMKDSENIGCDFIGFL